MGFVRILLKPVETPLLCGFCLLRISENCLKEKREQEVYLIIKIIAHIYGRLLMCQVWYDFKTVLFLPSTTLQSSSYASPCHREVESLKLVVWLRSHSERRVPWLCPSHPESRVDSGISVAEPELADQPLTPAINSVCLRSCGSKLLGALCFYWS